MLTKCACQSCGVNIEFDAESAGQNVACPSCDNRTRLVIPNAKPAPVMSSVPALGPCPDCGHPTSTRALMCPNCGCAKGVRFRFVWDVMCNIALFGLIWTAIVFVIRYVITLIGGNF